MSERRERGPPPHTYDKAIKDPVYGEKWCAACLDDFTGKYTELGSWELVKDLPPGRKAIKGKWGFSIKLKPDKNLVACKLLLMLVSLSVLPARMGGGLLAGQYAASPSTACLPAVSWMGGGLLAGLYAAYSSTACVPAVSVSA